MSTTKKEAEHSYYPGSKIVYDEPNKAQAAGKAQVQKGKVDISDPAVTAARDGASCLSMMAIDAKHLFSITNSLLPPALPCNSAVRDHKNATNWYA